MQLLVSYNKKKVPFNWGQNFNQAILSAFLRIDLGIDLGIDLRTDLGQFYDLSTFKLGCGGVLYR